MSAVSAPPFCLRKCCRSSSCRCELNCGKKEVEAEPREDGKLKGSCEACISSKIKCSGAQPCARCESKKWECEFEVEKKRGRPKGSMTSTICEKGGCWGPLNPDLVDGVPRVVKRFGLEGSERKIFSAFFAMYKNKARKDSCVGNWFAFRLRRMVSFLFHFVGAKHAAIMRGWMRDKGFENDPISKPCKGYAKGTLLPVTTFEEPSSKRQRRELQGPLDSEIERMRNEMCYLEITEKHDRLEILVNHEFVSLFGFSQEFLAGFMDTHFGGLLPWGGDIAALLMNDISDLLDHLRMIARKLKRVGRPKSLPATMEVFSGDMYNLVTRSGDIVECLVKFVFREKFHTTEAGESQVIFGIQPVKSDVVRLFSVSNQSSDDCEKEVTETVEGLGSYEFAGWQGMDDDSDGDFVGEHFVTCKNSMPEFFPYDDFLNSVLDET